MPKTAVISAGWVGRERLGRVLQRPRETLRSPTTARKSPRCHGGPGNSFQALFGPESRFARRAGRPQPVSSVGKDYGFTAVQNDAVFEVIAHRACQHPALDVAPLPNQIVRRVTVTDPFHVLLDDRSLVELPCHIVRRR